MEVNSILELWRDQAHVNDVNYPNTRTIKYLNLVKDNFLAAISASLSEDYNWDKVYTDSVVNQEEYTIPWQEWDEVEMIKVRNVARKHNWEFIQAKEVKPWSLPEHWDWYKVNQDPKRPIFFIADNSIFIAPVFTTVITNAVEFRGIKWIENYEVGWAESTIGFPTLYHDILVQWILPYIMKSQGKNEDAAYEKREYIRQRNQAIKEMAERHMWPTFLTYPSDWSSDNNTLQ